MLEGLSKAEVTQDESNMWSVEKDRRQKCLDQELCKNQEWPDKKSLEGVAKKEYNKADILNESELDGLKKTNPQVVSRSKEKKTP